MRTRIFVTIALLACCLATPVAAQEPSEQPITRYVADLRVALPKVPDNDGLAKPYGLAGVNLPGLGLGVEFGGHVYPIRRRSVAFGIGISGVFGRSHASPVTQNDGTVVGKDVTARFSAIAPQISFNFGSAAGWSYLSGGLGTARLEIRAPDTPPDTVWPRRKTINYGGGGRWFVRDRMAVTFDVRFYAMNPVAETPTIKPSPRLRMLVISIGVSVR
jgi:hypothetical protein